MDLEPIHGNYWQADLTSEDLSKTETAGTLLPPELGAQKLALFYRE
jgi:hypothetical protein